MGWRRQNPPDRLAVKEVAFPLENQMLFSLSIEDINSMISWVTEIWDSLGLLVWVLIGIPLAFWIVDEVIDALIARPIERRREEREEEEEEIEGIAKREGWDKKRRAGVPDYDYTEGKIGGTDIYVGRRK